MDRFLLIEDARDMRDLATAVFMGMGLRAELATAVDYEDAISKEGPFKGILTDLNYPGPGGRSGLGGIHAVKWFQQHEPNAVLLLYTGNGVAYAKERLAEAGVTMPETYIYTKPISFRTQFIIMSQRKTGPDGRIADMPAEANVPK